MQNNETRKRKKEKREWFPRKREETKLFCHEKRGFVGFYKKMSMHVL
jgi:hypothetical protein